MQQWCINAWTVKKSEEKKNACIMTNPSSLSLLQHNKGMV